MNELIVNNKDLNSYAVNIDSQLVSVPVVSSSLASVVVNTPTPVSNSIFPTSPVFGNTPQLKLLATSVERPITLQPANAITDYPTNSNSNSTFFRFKITPLAIEKPVVNEKIQAKATIIQGNIASSAYTVNVPIVQK